MTALGTYLPLTPQEIKADALCAILKRVFLQNVPRNHVDFYKPLIEFIQLLENTIPQDLNTAAPNHDLRTPCWWACYLGNPIALAELLVRGANAMDVGLGKLWTIEGDCETVAEGRALEFKGAYCDAYRRCAHELRQWKWCSGRYQKPKDIHELTQAILQQESLATDFLQNMIISTNISADREDTPLVPPYPVQSHRNISQVLTNTKRTTVPLKVLVSRQKQAAAHEEELVDYEDFAPVEPQRTNREGGLKSHPPSQSNITGAGNSVGQSTTNNLHSTTTRESVLNDLFFEEDTSEQRPQTDVPQKFQLRLWNFDPRYVTTFNHFDIFIRCSPFIFEELRKSFSANHMQLKIAAWIAKGRPKYVDWVGHGKPNISHSRATMVVPPIKGEIQVNLQKSEVLVEYGSAQDLDIARKLFTGRRYFPSLPSGGFEIKTEVVQSQKSSLSQWF